MATVSSGSSGIESFSFSGEKAGRAAASALKKISTLSDMLPGARLAEAIASLSDISAQSALEYERAALAVLKQEIAEAEEAISRANVLADKLNTHLAAEIPIPLPEFFKRKR
jgi:hypothetical protein